jgi:hypothetical protein
MSPQEKFICQMADEIRAGRLLITGDLDVRGGFPSYVEAHALNKLEKPWDQEFFTIVAKLDCRKVG